MKLLKDLSRKSSILFLLFILFIFTFSFNCASKHDNSIDKSQINLKIVDSIVFDTNNEFVLIRSFNNDYYLGVNAANDKLFLFNSYGKKMRIIASKGEGPLEYEQILNYGLTPSNDIVVFDGSKVLIFENNSNKIKRICTIDVNETLPEFNDNRLFVNNDYHIIMSSSSMGNPSFKEYFQSARTFTVMDTTCQHKNLGGYPEGNMFLKKVYIMGYDTRTWIPANEEDKIFQMFRWDRHIYVWDSKTGGVIQTIDLHPDYFGEIIHKKESSMENMFYSLQRNARFIDFIVGSKYIVTYYMTGVKEEDVSMSMEKYNSQLDKLVRRLFSVYDREGNKIGADFSNSKIKYLTGFDENGRLLFQDDEEDGSTVIYIAEFEMP